MGTTAGSREIHLGTHGGAPHGGKDCHVTPAAGAVAHGEHRHPDIATRHIEQGSLHGLKAVEIHPVNAGQAATVTLQGGTDLV